jgi:type VI secretion system protein ImpE
MTATDLFKAGKLQEAIAAQLKEVKSAPADQGKRLFLFELLAFAGDLERARKQIEAVTYNELERDAAVQSYNRVLDAEEARRRLFRDSLLPKFFGEQPDHVRLRFEAVNRLRENRTTEAAELVAQANAAAPPLSGKLNDKAFDSLRDCDDLFGSVLEVMGAGGYYWVPLEQVESIALAAPRFPRDLLWRAARLELRDGSGGNVFLPALYAGSHEHGDDQVKLGRATDWKEWPGGLVQGFGLRTYLVGDDAVSLLDWRQLELA